MDEGLVRLEMFSGVDWSDLGLDLVGDDLELVEGASRMIGLVRRYVTYSSTK